MSKIDEMRKKAILERELEEKKKSEERKKDNEFIKLSIEACIHEMIKRGSTYCFLNDIKEKIDRNEISYEINENWIVSVLKNMGCSLFYYDKITYVFFENNVDKKRVYDIVTKDPNNKQTNILTVSAIVCFTLYFAATISNGEGYKISIPIAVILILLNIYILYGVRKLKLKGIEIIEQL